MAKGAFQMRFSTREEMIREGIIKDQDWRNNTEIGENVVKYNRW